MKNYLKFILLITLVIIINSITFAVDYVSLTINYSTIGTTEGYDHLTKMRVFFDEKEAGENTPKKQSIPNSVTVDIPKGTHKIKAILYAKNEGVWEERTLANDYSFDCLFEKTIDFNGNNTIDLLFDFKELIVKEKTNKDNSGSTSMSSSGSNYKDALAKVNTFLKTFDNGYYGYLEIIDGYLYDRFSSGKYTKSLMTDLSKAEEETYKKKVRIKCKNDADCVFSTYTDSYHKQLSFSQTADFNTSELISLLNNLIESYNSKKTEKNTSNTSDLDKYKSNIDIMNSGSSSSKAVNYQTALDKLNTYLKTFDNGYYGYFEVKDGYIYDRFKAGKYNKFKMEDMEGAIVQTQYSRVIFKCKSGSCISTDWKENGKEEYTQFTKGGSYNYQELADLLNNFKDAYLGSKSNSSSTTVVSTTISKPNLQTALTELNAYMKTFDGDRYKGMEVKDGYVYSNYSNNNYSKAKVEDLDYVKLNTEFKYIKLACKGDNKCVYSTITGSYHEYFNFQTSTGKDLNKMVDLLENFLAALKGKSKINTSTQSAAVSVREQKDKERQKQKTTATEEDYDDFFGLFTDAPTSTTKSSTSASTTNSSTPNPSKYMKALNALNDYLKVFNSEVYKSVEVKEGKVFFNFYVYGANYNSSIPINELTQNTTIVKGKSVGAINDDEIKIFCKGDKKCFYSSYNKSDADHFRFFSRTEKDLTKMKQLVEEFVNSLK